MQPSRNSHVMCPWYPLRRTKTPQGRCHLLEVEASSGRRHLGPRCRSFHIRPAGQARRTAWCRDRICTARARSSYHARRASWPVFLKTLATPTRRWRSVVPMHSYLCGKKSYYQRRTARARHQVHGGAPNSITPSVRPVHTRLGHARASTSRTSRPQVGGTYCRWEKDGAVHGMAAALGRTSALADGRPASRHGGTGPHARMQ